MADSMIERVAKALAEESHGAPTKWQLYVDDAKAVLTALRNPTDAMMRAGVEAPNHSEDKSSRQGCANIYRAMINAALAEDGR